MRLAAQIALQRFAAIMPDAFDTFLQTFASKDLQVLVNEEKIRSQNSVKRSRSPVRAPKQKARPAASVTVESLDEHSGDDTEPSPVEVEEPPPASLQQPDGKDTQDVFSKLDTIKAEEVGTNSILKFCTCMVL